MAKLDLKNTFKDIQFDQPERMLGKGSMMPFNGANSGSRKLMFGTHLEQRLPLCNPDVPYIQTGYEKEFGKYSSSYVSADTDYEIFDKIDKFSHLPGHHQYVIAIDHEHKRITVFENKKYKHITESYGYIYSNDSALNYVEPGMVIPKGSPIMKAKSFDEYDNRMDGKNLLTIYTSCEETMEDAIVISETAAKKLSSPLIKRVFIQINDNDIPLNLYVDGSNKIPDIGSNVTMVQDGDSYKIFPDIGEHTQHSILAGMRVEKKEESLYSLSYNRLKELMISDQRYVVSGRVVDIDVYCNAPQNFIDNPYYGQIEFYYKENLEMCKSIVEDVDVHLQEYFHQGYQLDFEMQKLYSNCLGILNGKQYYTNGKAFSNMMLQITVIDEIPILRGDKITNRYGGKGITSRIRPDSEMPMTKEGKRIDVLLNICGVYGRENAGQQFELSISYISMKIVEFIKTRTLSVDECVKMILDFTAIVSPKMHDYLENLFSTMSDSDLIMYFDTICDENSLYLAIEPMSEAMSIEKLEKIYDTFPWIQPEKILMPITNSVGKIRYVESRRPVVYGYLYFYRLKQYAKEKFNVTSLSSTNIRNENTRNKANNNYKALFARTPIRFGDMEIGNLNHVGADLVSQILMIYSSSPLARQLCAALETGDPFNVDVRLDMDSKNRNAEILNVYLKTKGIALRFKKHLKKKEYPMLVQPMAFNDLNAPQDPMILYKKGIEQLDWKKHAEELIEKSKRGEDPMIFYPMEFFDELEATYEVNDKVQGT